MFLVCIFSLFNIINIVSYIEIISVFNISQITVNMFWLNTIIFYLQSPYKKHKHLFVTRNPSFGIWCGVIYRMRQWRHWTSLWENEKNGHIFENWTPIWGLDVDLRLKVDLSLIYLINHVSASELTWFIRYLLLKFIVPLWCKYY